MRNKAVDALSYSYSVSDRVVFDANILVCLFSGLEPPNSVPVRKYSKVLKHIQQGKAEILLDVLVLSEYVNVCTRKYYRLSIDQGGTWRSFKEYRQSADFGSVAPTITQTAKQIEKLARRLDHPFSAWPVPQILDDFGTGKHDVNDQFIVELCRHEGALLLTDDKEVITGGITVLTTHPQLLAACP